MFQIFGWILCLAIVLKYQAYVVYLIKTKISTYISYKEKFELYIEIHHPVAVSTFPIKLLRKNILLSDAAVILYKAGSRKDIEDRHIKFTLSAGTYSIENFNAKD